MACSLSFVILFTIFIRCYSQEETAANIFAIQPQEKPIVVLNGSIVSYTCEVRDTRGIHWNIFSKNQSYRYVCSTAHSLGIECAWNRERNTISIPIQENGVGNDTRVWCTAGSGNVNSRNGTILIQGSLAAVSNLTTELNPGRSIFLSWFAPFTLNLTYIEPDITYCVDVNVTSRHIRSTCNITATSYNVTFNEGEITPCDTVNVTITSVSGFLIDGSHNNGTRRYLDPIHLFEVPGNFSASEVKISSRELDPDRMQFDIQLPDSVHICRTNCSIFAFSGSTSYHLNSSNHLTCHRNMITFNVSNGTGSALPIREIFSVYIQVANSAGMGNLVGNISLRTHTIQLSVHEDESSMQINITFARNSSARGAQVILKPEILNDSTCSNLIIINLEKMDDSISTTIKDILRGTYNIKIYTLNHNGIPESHAEPGAVKKEIFQGIMQGSTSSTHGISVERVNDTAINLRLPAREDGYVAIDSSSYRSAYSVYQIPGNTTVYQVPHNGNVSCLSLFPRHKDNGILSSNTSVSLLITNKRSTTTTRDIIIAVSVLVVVGVIIILILCIICKYKCKSNVPGSTGTESPDQNLQSDVPRMDDHTESAGSSQDEVFQDTVYGDVDNTILHEDDIDDIMDELKNVLPQYYRGIGSRLRLKSDTLKVIGRENPTPAQAMEAVITEWLKMNYNTTEVGPPTWKALVAAVANSLGGNNKAEAERIAGRHKVGTSSASIGAPVTPSTSFPKSNTSFSKSKPIAQRHVEQAVIGITKEWRSFAVALELNQADIAAISGNYSHNVADCLSEVIKLWFQENGKKVSWENLCKALRDPMVNRRDLAEKIEEKYH